MAGYKIISADSHVAEPPELYTELVAPEFRHRTPTHRAAERAGRTGWWRVGRLVGWTWPRLG